MKRLFLLLALTLSAADATPTSGPTQLLIRVSDEAFQDCPKLTVRLHSLNSGEMLIWEAAERTQATLRYQAQGAVQITTICAGNDKQLLGADTSTFSGAGVLLIRSVAGDNPQAPAFRPGN